MAVDRDRHQMGGERALKRSLNGRSPVSTRIGCESKGLGGQPRASVAATLRERPVGRRPDMLEGPRLFRALTAATAPPQGTIEARPRTEPRHGAGKAALREGSMTESVYKVIELVGSSTKSWEKAAQAAVERAAHSLRDLRVAEVVAQDVVIENGKVEAYRTKVKLSFKYEGKD